MTPLAEAPVLTKEQLLELLSEPLTQVIRDELDRPNEAARLAQVAIAERNYLYWQGKQYLTPKYDTEARTIGYVSALEGPNRNRRKFASCYNIIYGDGIKFVAIVGQRRPNQKCVPDIPDDEEQNRKAKDADAAKTHLHRTWEIRRRMKEIAFHLWTTGPVFFYTHYVADGHKYGWTQEPVMDVAQQELPEGGTRGVPNITGVEQYPKGAVELDILSIFHVSVPFGKKSLGDCDWLNYQAREPKHRIKAIHPDLPDEISEGAEDTPTERDAAEAIDKTASPTGTQEEQADRKWLYELRWIRPKVYEALEKEHRDLLYERFPNGLKVIRVQGKVIDLVPEKLDDYWTVCKTGTGEYINSEPLCFTYIPVQDDTNDFFNMGRETILRGIPKVLVDGQLIDTVALEKNEPVIAEVIRTKLGTGQDIGKMIGQLPTARFSDQLMPFWKAIRDTSRENGGISPVLFGGGPPTPTYREAAQRKNQALMQLQPPFDEMQMSVAGFTTNGIRELARYGSDTVTVPPETGGGLEESYVLNLAMLQEDGWHVEPEESVPMSFGEKVERIGQIAAENPGLAQSIGMTHPMNVESVHQMFGVEDFYQPGAHERAKVLKVIQRLLTEAPLQDMDPMTGQVIELPSIEPDEFTDKNHIFFVEIVRAWCNSPAGLRQEETNPEGYRNVKLYPDGEPAPPGPAPPEQSEIPPVTDSPVAA
jgi:hypothetical protein